MQHSSEKPFSIKNSNFSLEQIYDSGQCFRMSRLPENRYQVIAHGKRLELRQSGEEVEFFCTEREYEEIWKHYFDLETDYGAFIEKIGVRDRYLTAAAQFGSGIRILNQDLWEMIITFIISQQNNIKRIRKCIETICREYGTERDGFFDFPTPEALAASTEEELRACGLGYRSRYLAGTAGMMAAEPERLERLRAMRYQRAREELLTFPGIGGKVADCVCLFGLHHLDAFPVDTHIRQALERRYPKGFPMRRYSGCRGVMQQYIFYYDLHGGDQEAP